MSSTPQFFQSLLQSYMKQIDNTIIDACNMFNIRLMQDISNNRHAVNFEI